MIWGYHYFRKHPNVMVLIFWFTSNLILKWQLCILNHQNPEWSCNNRSLRKTYPFGMFGRKPCWGVHLQFLRRNLGVQAPVLVMFVGFSVIWLKDGKRECKHYNGLYHWDRIMNMFLEFNVWYGMLEFWKIMSAFSSSDRGTVPIWDYYQPIFHGWSIWMQAFICHNHSFVLCFILPWFGFEAFFNLYKQTIGLLYV